MEGKKTYKYSYRKREVREIIFSLLDIAPIYGMPGPDLLNYINQFNDYPSLTLYEYDEDVILKHNKIILNKGLSVNYHPISIINAPFYKSSIYDLDFCKSIVYHEDCVKKFNGANEIFTFSTRSNQISECKKFTINRFFKLRGEEILSEEPYYNKFRVIRSDKSNYLMRGYCGADNGKRGSPMLVIANVKNKL